MTVLAAGVGSLRPAASTARARAVCVPFERFRNVQKPELPATQSFHARASIRHWILQRPQTVPFFIAIMWNFAVFVLVFFEMKCSCVFGAAASAEALPNARTESARRAVRTRNLRIANGPDDTTSLLGFRKDSCPIDAQGAGVSQRLRSGV